MTNNQLAALMATILQLRDTDGIPWLADADQKFINRIFDTYNLSSDFIRARGKDTE